jgi:hypothetical protein
MQDFYESVEISALKYNTYFSSLFPHFNTMLIIFDVFSLTLMMMSICKINNQYNSGVWETNF